jgi:hypoxanthine phosphoribosyltransferase
VYLSAAELATRVGELAAEIVGDYEGKNPILVASLKSSLVFLADLSRALRIPHELDFLELAGY